MRPDGSIPYYVRQREWEGGANLPLDCNYMIHFSKRPPIKIIGDVCFRDLLTWLIADARLYPPASGHGSISPDDRVTRVSYYPSRINFPDDANWVLGDFRKSFDGGLAFVTGKYIYSPDKQAREALMRGEGMCFEIDCTTVTRSQALFALHLLRLCSEVHNFGLVYRIVREEFGMDIMLAIAFALQWAPKKPKAGCFNLYEFFPVVQNVHTVISLCDIDKYRCSMFPSVFTRMGKEESLVSDASGPFEVISFIQAGGGYRVCDPRITSIQYSYPSCPTLTMDTIRNFVKIWKGGV